MSEVIRLVKRYPYAYLGELFRELGRNFDVFYKVQHRTDRGRGSFFGLPPLETLVGLGFALEAIPEAFIRTNYYLLRYVIVKK